MEELKRGDVVEIATTRLRVGKEFASNGSFGIVEEVAPFGHIRVRTLLQSEAFLPNELKFVVRAEEREYGAGAIVQYDSFGNAAKLRAVQIFCPLQKKSVVYLVCPHSWNRYLDKSLPHPFTERDVVEYFKESHAEFIGITY